MNSSRDTVRILICILMLMLKRRLASRLGLLLSLTSFSARSPYYWPVIEAEIPERFEGPPSSTEESYLTEEQERIAAQILKKSGIVERINGGQRWAPDFEVPRRANVLSGSRGVAVEVISNTAVDGSGPCHSIRCQGRLKQVHKQQWTRITRLIAWVDMDSELVAGYAVIGDEFDVPQPVIGSLNWFAIVRVYNVESGELLITGPPILVSHRSLLCPQGTYYRD